jgi:basic amino acid/polyamine antiporter, APA family
MDSSKAPVFIRNATGLVRSLNARDLLFYNFVSFGAAWSIIYAVEYAPLYGGDPVLSLILTAPGILALLGIYYIFQGTMPRAGGDYVYMSRTLTPALGLAANFSGVAFFNWFWIGDAAAVFTSQGLAQTLSVYGSLTGSQWATNLAGAFTPWVTFAVGTIAIIVFTAILLFGNRLYFRIQNVSMIVAVLGIIIFVILLASTNSTSFANVLNNYASKQGVNLTSGAYQNITNAGVAYWGGSVPTSPLSGNTLTLIPLWFTVLFWVYGSGYLGGETKNTKSTAKIALFGGFLLVFLTTISVLGLSYLKLGANFLAGAGYYALGYAANPLPVLPNLTLFTALLSNNSLLVWFIGIGVVAGFVVVAPQSMLTNSRILFSYSFDRVAPMALADVSDRWHTPTKAILLSASGGEVFLLFLSGVIGPSTSSYAFLLYSYAGLATIGVTFTFMSISGILLPTRRKDLYDLSSPVKRKILGLPVVTWLGIISLVYVIATIGYYTYDYNFYFGTGTLAAVTYFPFLAALVGLFVACFVWYFVAKSYRNRAGIALEKVYQEIPPE